MSAGDSVRARVALEQLLAENPRSARVHYLLGRVADFKELAGADTLHRNYSALRETDRKFADELITLLATKPAARGSRKK